MTLRRFALTVAGPIDAAINLLLNGAICWFFLRSATSLPLTGSFSAESFLAPMFFLLFCLATYFGIRNGVIQRQNGLSGQPLAHDVRWRGWAIRLGISYGLSACTVFLIAIHLLDGIFPGLVIPARGLVLFQALLSAALGYCVQAYAVIKTAALRGAESPDRQLSPE